MSHWCKDHVTYEAKRQPRSECKRCWDLYDLSHPEEKPPVVREDLDPNLVDFPLA